jgi:hypothetical protein
VVAKAKQYSKAEELMDKGSPQLKEMFDKLKVLTMELEKLVEKVRLKAWKEGFTDKEVGIIIKYVIDPLPISLGRKQAILKQFTPVKEVKIEKITSRSQEDKTELKVLIVKFKMITGNPKEAKKLLCREIMESGDDEFEIHMVDEDVVGFKRCP